MSLEKLISTVAHEVQAQLTAMYAQGVSTPGSALDQLGLRNGADIVLDYLTHGEAGAAFDHLLYMIIEPDLALPAPLLSQLRQAADHLGHPRETLAPIRRAAGG